MHAVVNAWHVRQLVDPLRRRTHYVHTSELRITPLKNYVLVERTWEVLANPGACLVVLVFSPSPKCLKSE